jgi:hypothetical protein
MKAQAFLELVGKMMTKQQDYFTAKRQGLIKAKDLLIESKELEKQVRAVVKEGKLEPDEPTAMVEVHTTEAFQRMFDFSAEPNPESLYSILNGQGEHP